MTADAITRPVLRWHGGKFLLASWIIEHFPQHRVYVEPFGGAASVLIQKPRTYAEVYNDLDGDVVNLFRVLRDPCAAAMLTAQLRDTPFARIEFEAAYEPCAEPVERARRLVVRSFMGFGSAGASRGSRTGFRSNSNRSGTTPARDWLNYPDALAAISARLRGVVVESRTAVEVMKAHDSAETLCYVDPPYVPETRSPAKKGGAGIHTYAHELSREDHVALLADLCRLKGMVILSGYPCALYDDALQGWTRRHRRALADGAQERTEVLWINPAAAARLADGPLFVTGGAHERILGGAVGVQWRTCQLRSGRSRARGPPIASAGEELSRCPVQAMAAPGASLSEAGGACAPDR